MSVPGPGWFGALGSWVHFVGGDGDEGEWWQQPGIHSVLWVRRKSEMGQHIRRSTSVLDKFPGAGREVKLLSGRVRHLFILLDQATPKICQMGRGEWTLVCCTIYPVLENIVEDVLLSIPKFW